MSHRTFNELWSEAQGVLDDAARSDNNQILSKPSKDRDWSHRQLSSIYLKYIIAINKLAECYDQMVHPQKRLLVRKILDTSIIRYLELKLEFVNLMFSEYTHLDDGIQELGILPQDTELLIPECYRRERSADIEWKQKFIDDTLFKIGIRDEKPEGIQMTEDEAILLIQMHERARQYRMRAQTMKNMRELKDRSRPKEEDIPEASRKAALKIQRMWRGFVTRRKIRKRVLEEMLLIGMLEPDTYPTKERDCAAQMKEKRYWLQNKHEVEYQDMLFKEKERIQKYESNVIIDGIRDEVRNWYIGYKQQTGKFPDIPSDEAGGSAAVVGRQSPFLVGSDVSHSTTAFQSIDSKSSRSKKSSETQEDKRKKSSESDDIGYKLAPSNVLLELESFNMEYEEIWKDLDESDNPEQTYCLYMIRAQKTKEVEAELRKIVDSQLRAELENLQAALDRDQKGKRVKKASKKKTRRSGKKSKKKKEKDLTPDRSTESLFEELVANGIIRKYPHTPLTAFCGELNYVGYNYQCSGKDMPPTLGDVRQMIRDYCILPMCSPRIHQNSPLLRSLLLAGPKSSGKDMLVNAICTETGAVLFDLTAANIAGKYPGKAGLIMLIHLVNKVSKLLQPAIIYINNAERTFWKKVPKTDKTDPKRLKKDLQKITKSIGPTDLVMLIGVTHAPWDCDQKSLVQNYNKLVMMLRPDYASLKSLWSELLIRYNAYNRQLDLCALTKLCDGYTAGTLFKVMQKLMTCKRTLQLKIKPLHLTEILEVLAQHEPVYKEEEDAFVQWYAKTPMGRNRQRALELENEQNTMENDTPSVKHNSKT